MDLCFVNCLKFADSLGKITMHYDDEFKKTKIIYAVMNVVTENVKILMEKI